jgi:tetratricopeptide (TPR) repeat protein
MIGRTCLILWFMFFSLRGMAESPVAAFDNANKLYEQGKFDDAAKAYEKMVQTGHVSEPLYFNWGNALFKAGHIGQAIAAYQQAERIAPRDPDVRANLQFARNQVQGPTYLPERFWRWLGKLSLKEWTWVAAASLWAWLLMLTLVQWRPILKSVLKPYTLWLGVLALSLCACFSAAFYYSRLFPLAIVVAQEAVARQAPLEESQTAFTLHDGAEIEVLDQKDQWFQVQADAKRIGWVRRDALVRSGSK